MRLTLPVLLLLRWLIRPRTIGGAAGVFLITVISGYLTHFVQMSRVRAAAKELNVGDRWLDVSSEFVVSDVSGKVYGPSFISCTSRLGGRLMEIRDDAIRFGYWVRFGDSGELRMAVDRWGSGRLVDPKDHAVVVMLSPDPISNRGLVRRVWIDGQPVVDGSDREFDALVRQRYLNEWGLADSESGDD